MLVIILLSPGGVLSEGFDHERSASAAGVGSRQGMRARGRFQPHRGYGGLEVVSRKPVGSSRKPVGMAVGMAVGRLIRRLEGGWKW
jgi:hypothetical protein